MREQIRKRRLLAILLSAGTTLAALFVAVHVEAVTTRTIDLDDASDFTDGELQETTISSLGEVRVGFEVRKVPIPDIAAVWSMAELGNGEWALGTGNQGKVYRVRGETVTPYAETGQLVVSALAKGEGGDLFAGTLPGAKIYRIRGEGQATELASLPNEAEHVWALVYDPRRRVLFAATGPSGTIFAVDATGHAEVYFDSEETHILSLALAPDGTLYAGTSPGAILLQIDGPGRARALVDFPGVEVKSIALRQAASAGSARPEVYAAVNEFDSPPTPPSASQAKAPPAPAAPAKASPPSTTANRPKPGKGSVWRVRADGSSERLLRNDEGHFTAIEVDASGVAYASAGSKGRVFSVDDERVVRVMLDVEERQVMAISLVGQTKAFATGDAGAFYRVGGSAPRTATYLSKVYDTAFVSSWGNLSWRGQGRLVFQTRTGNTEAPDATWSDWSAGLERPGRISSPPGRYLQFRAKWERDQSAVLRAVEVFYLNRNQRAIVTEVTVRNKALPTKLDDEAVAQASSSPPPRSAIFKIAWKVDNPDHDGLRYRLHFREEGEGEVWRPITRPQEVLTKTEYEWDTESVPAGYYVIKVSVTDERSNPAERVARHELVSPPALVDNDPPAISGLAASALRVSGRAVDGFSPIARLEYAVDGGLWEVVFPSDDLLDGREEAFAFDVAGDGLAPGSHVVTVRAFDEAGNQTTARAGVRAGGR
ncbi:MAG: hypothetical protein HYY06_01040 [Deltaproteobacteria bacterium]|nr:hypothetical protein [Deltaproteobacteria bacterium]